MSQEQLILEYQAVIGMGEAENGLASSHGPVKLMRSLKCPPTTGSPRIATISTTGAAHADRY